MTLRKIWGLLFVVFLFSCNPNSKEVSNGKVANPFVSALKNIKSKVREPLSEIEKKLLEIGLIDVVSLDSTILVDLKYATTDNFMGMNLYGNLRKAFLQKDVAEKLVNAQKYLKEINSEYIIIVYDAARPKSIQQKMWDTLKITSKEKLKFVAFPNYGSLHNYGAAVDVSIVDKNQNPLDMGCDFDNMTELAGSVNEEELLKAGKLNNEQIKNRKLLRKVMNHAGFWNIQSEWWHFNACKL
ncbi:MAG: M15 family metallopeptidase, partial [Bacteroidetes bacterium]|nr:M15 family metallopeptidase [Bacteroidota bacterium]